MTLRLIGDIGGTNARFALSREGHYDRLESHAGQDYDSFEAAIDAYVSKLPADQRPTEAAFALAGPVGDDEVALTNHPWKFSQKALKEHFGFDRLMIVNDFTANALSLPYLGPQDADKIGAGEAKAGQPIGILGPGTGLGVSGLLTDEDGKHLPLTGEGGHVTMAPANQREGRVLDILRDRFDHVSAERVLSGDGLVNLYNALCELDNTPSAGYKPTQITDEATGQTDRHCREAVSMFCAMLGTIAGDLALTLGSGGGIYIAGGIIPRLGHRFSASPFRSQFENKGRFRAYLSRIPTFLITHPNPALVGLARMP